MCIRFWFRNCFVPLDTRAYNILRTASPSPCLDHIFCGLLRTNFNLHTLAFPSRLCICDVDEQSASTQHSIENSTSIQHFPWHAHWSSVLVILHNSHTFCKRVPYNKQLLITT
eukprot:c26460_g1_i1 orf=177-515(-)